MKKGRFMSRSGIITQGVGGLFEIELEDGALISCRAKGNFKREIGKLAVGDRVSIETDDNGNSVIATVMQRKNSLIRPAMANLDRIFVTVPAKDPTPDLFTVDKLLAIAHHQGIKCTVVITKNDLDTGYAKELEEMYSVSGFDTFCIGEGDSEGVQKLFEYYKENCKDEICAFSGASGVGKSTLMNKLFKGLSLETSHISEKIARGRHTTRAVTLYSAKRLLGQGSGYLADTPGFTMLDFERFDFFGKQDLVNNFIEFAPYIGKCRYTDCTHLSDEDCAILEAMAKGKIAKSRHESYVMLYHILKNKHAWDKK